MQDCPGTDRKASLSLNDARCCRVQQQGTVCIINNGHDRAHGVCVRLPGAEGSARPLIWEAEVTSWNRWFESTKDIQQSDDLVRVQGSCKQL